MFMSLHKKNLAKKKRGEGEVGVGGGPNDPEKEIGFKIVRNREKREMRR